MIEISFLAFIIPAFVAGLLTFLAPCTLPIVPAYLGFIGGSSLGDLKDPARIRQAKQKILLNSVFYVLGFSVVFIVFGVLAGLLGQALAPFRIWLTRIAGLFIILFGLFMLNLFSVSLFSTERRFALPSSFKRGTPLTSFALGSAFALGWTPCVGPILGSILALTTSSTTATEGAILLAVFSAGLAIPFLLIAAGVGSASAKIIKYSSLIKKYRVPILVVFGVFLGFLFNIAAAGFLSIRFLAAFGNASRMLLEGFQYVFPIVTAIILGIVGYRREVDPFAVITGLLLVGVGVILMTNSFTLLIAYSFRFTGFFEYRQLLDFL